MSWSRAPNSKTMNEFSTIAAVDLGSNSFRLQVARVEDDHIYPLDSLKETVRLAAGLDDDNALSEDAQERALTSLKRFGERLRGMPVDAVRAVGTNTLRVAKNSDGFLRKAQKALGFPIEVVAGHEEARLIYLGVAHGLPLRRDRRLVVDIGGGSTECIIGRGFQPVRVESLYMGCVGFSQRYFPDGKLSARAFKEAELAAATELDTIVHDFTPDEWRDAIGSSGTARAIAEVLESAHPNAAGITSKGMAWIKDKLVSAGDVRKLDFAGLRDDRKPVFAGGFAIMSAVFKQLRIESMHTTECGLRDGVLWDMLGRIQHRDVRDTTVKQFMRRYQVDHQQAVRVEKLSANLFTQLASEHPDPEHVMPDLAWAARLHEIGVSISYPSYHKHSAYILGNADMPGFSKMEQANLARWVLGCRGSLTKVAPLIENAEDWLPVLALRLAVLLHRGRMVTRLGDVRLAYSGKEFGLGIDTAWLERNPLTAAAIEAEVKVWKSVNLRLVFENYRRNDNLPEG
jgi:exopolyphosphatase / guanosine-5'-triphosphate,3'-diphosphate pyrophosphatase